MKIGLVADTHFDDQDLACQVRRWSALLAAAARHRVRLLLHAGDLIDAYRLTRRGVRPAAVLRCFEPAYRRFVASGGSMYAIKGNHDGVDGREQALFELPWSRCVLFCRPAVVETDELVLLFLPWNRWRERQSLQELASKLPDRQGRRTILVGHLELEESDTDPACSMYRQGRFRFCLRDLDALSVDCLALGHFHVGDAHYLGSFRRTLVEENDPVGHGFCVLDSETGASERFCIDATGTVRSANG